MLSNRNSISVCLFFNSDICSSAMSHAGYPCTHYSGTSEPRVFYCPRQCLNFKQLSSQGALCIAYCVWMCAVEWCWRCEYLSDRLLHFGLSGEDAERYLKSKNGYHGLFLLRTGKKNTFTISVRYLSACISVLLYLCLSVCVSAFVSVCLYLCLCVSNEGKCIIYKRAQ